MVLPTHDAAFRSPQGALRVLLLEDDPDHAERCLREFRKAHLDVCCDVLKTREEFIERLRSHRYDVVLADYNLGCWTGMEALQILRSEGQTIPLILVTGALGDQKAAECINSGVADYVLKDRLERLPVAILRAVDERELRAEYGRIERSAQENEVKCETLVEAIPAGIFIEEGTRCRYANRAAQNITGHTQEELLSMSFWQLLVPQSRDAVLWQTIRHFREEEPSRRYQVEILTKQKRIKTLDVTVGMFPRNRGVASLITALEAARPQKPVSKACEEHKSHGPAEKYEMRPA